jgi:hypothetical protein
MDSPETGRAGPPPAGSQQTTIKPTPSFAAHVPASLGCWESFSREEQPEVLILKGPKNRETGRSEEIEYAETRETRRLRKEVQLINGYLRKAPLRIVGDGSPLGAADDGQPIDPSWRAVRRIFNNGSWRDDG